MTLPTGGKWPGVVGAAGYVLCNWNGPAGVGTVPPANDVVSLPSGMTYTPQFASAYSFQVPSATAPARATENAAGTEGAGGCWFNTGTWTVTFSCATNDPFNGTVSVYCCDYDSSGRAQTVSDGTTTQTVTSFSAGKWLQFSESIEAGSPLTLTFTPDGGNNQALAMGVFFDATGSPPPPPPSGTATISAVDPEGTVKSVTINLGSAPPAPPVPETPPVVT